MKNLSISLLLSTALFTGAFASITDVDLERSLLVDVSGSVNLTDYNLMIEGYALAFENASIHDAIAAGAIGAVAINMLQFDEANSEVIPWSLLDSSTASNSFVTAIRNVIRAGSGIGGTGVAQGLDAAVAHFASSTYEAPWQVTDLSGDGSENQVFTRRVQCSPGFLFWSIRYPAARC